VDALAAWGARFDSPYGKEIQRFVRHGVGVHHAGLLPKYRLLVEKLAQKGMLKIVSGTDTLGVGVNVPIRTVLFTKLCKFDGEKTAILSVRDFQQIAGRAGRKGFDDQGSVVVQAPEHVIENLRLEAKAGNDPAKKKKIVRKKPPDHGYVHWDRPVFDRLVSSHPEPLVSRFTVTHGMVVNVLTREAGGGCMALARLVKASHERDAQKRIHGRTAFEMIRSLRDAKILSFEESRRVVVHADFGEDFSVHHALALYLVDALKGVPPSSETYALDVLTLVESILENPEVVLLRQLDKLKRETLAELKAQGVEYEQRMEELEKLEYPKPNREFVYATFNAFAAAHPWVRAENIRPKSIAREMFESFMSFSEYVREYGLERSEGLLLRYLSDVYKALLQSMPRWAKSDAVEDVTTWLGAVVRQVDASLLDEWERMKNPADRIEPLGRETEAEPVEPAGSRDVTKDKRAFTVLVRNEIFRFVRALARRDFAEAARVVVTEEGAGPEVREAARIEAELGPYFAEHPTIRTDPAARSPQLLAIEEGETSWRVRQTLLDPDGDEDWYFEATIDLGRSREAARPVLALERFAR
jgi:hypothetical protein